MIPSKLTVGIVSASVTASVAQMAFSRPPDEPSMGPWPGAKKDAPSLSFRTLLTMKKPAAARAAREKSSRHSPLVSIEHA
jgi:hypothetical protein